MNIFGLSFVLFILKWSAGKGFYYNASIAVLSILLSHYDVWVWIKCDLIMQGIAVKYIINLFSSSFVWLKLTTRKIVKSL